MKRFQGAVGAITIALLLVSDPAQCQQVTIFGVPAGTGWPLYITQGPRTVGTTSGALWFTGCCGDGTISHGTINQLLTSGAVVSHSSSALSIFVWGITQGSDGALWVADQLGQIARFDLSNLTLYSLGNPSPYPYLITSGADGALWFAENNSGNIGRITTAGSYSTFSVNGAQNPYGITTGSDGAIWFTDKGANA
jgi:virginiamycin B lyase